LYTQGSDNLFPQFLYTLVPFLVRIVITLNPRIKLILPWGNNMNNSTLPDLNLEFHINYILLSLKKKPLKEYAFSVTTQQ
jgi:hypothetical protein